MYHLKKRLTALALVLATVVTMIMPAFAEGAVAKVTGDDVRIRTKADIDSEAYQMASKGDKYKVLKEADEDGWVKIEFTYEPTGEKKKGYISADFVKISGGEKKTEEAKPAEEQKPAEEAKPTEEKKDEQKETAPEVTAPAEAEEKSEEKKDEKEETEEKEEHTAAISENVSYTATVANNGVRIRKEPNTDSEILTTLGEEQIVIVYPGEDEEGWLKVKYYDEDGKKYKGYMSGEFLDINSIGTGTCSVSAAIVRDEAKKNAEISGVIPDGAKVDIYASDNGWYKVEYMDISGWVDAECITTESDSSVLGYAKIHAEGLNLRAKPTRKSDSLTHLDNGAVLAVNGSAKGGKWLACTYNGYTGYIRSTYADVTDTCPEGGYVQVTGSSLSLRSGAGTEFTRLATIPQGKVLKLEGAVGSWYLVTYKKFTGYISSAFASPTSKDGFQAYPDYGEITANSLTLRKDASTDSDGLGSIPKGTILAITGMSNGWYQVNYGGQIGYIDSGYVERSSAAKAAAAAEAAARYAESASRNSSESQQQTTAATPSKSGGSILGYASQFVGNPYSWGGSSLTKGTDCSGFVKSVLAHFGYSVPHSSSAIRSCGRSVSVSDMRPGDVVCYSGHVGIYAGNGQLLSALGKKYGITYNSVHYKKILSVRRFG